MRLLTRVGSLGAVALLVCACGTSKEAKSVRTSHGDAVQASPSIDTDTKLPEAIAQDATATVGAQTEESTPAGPLALTWDDGVSKILTGNCGSCHGVTAAGGAPAEFQLTSFGLEHGKPGAGTKLDDLRRVIADGSMPPAPATLADADVEKVLRWLDSGAPENQSAAAASGGGLRGIAVAAPPALAGNKVTIKVRAFGGEGATWTAIFTKTQGATTGGTMIMSKIPVSTSTIEWDVSKVPAGLYYIYVHLQDGMNTKDVASPDAIQIGPASTGTTNAVVEFRIPAGTAKGVWNTEATMVNVKVGQTLRIINDDTVGHRMHTGGAPCGHQPNVTPPGGSYDCVVSRVVDPTGKPKPGTYDHGNGSNASFWVKAVMP